MSKNTKEIAAANIVEKLDALNKEKGLELEFVEFKNGVWKNKHTHVIIKCNIHNKLIETEYRYIVYKKIKDIIVCPDCLKEKVGSVHRRFDTEEDLKKFIIEKIDKLNHEGKNIEFIGFKNKYNGRLSTCYINIKCNVHNTIKA